MSSIVRKAVNRTLPGFEEPCTEWGEPFFFIQAADTQLGFIENFVGGRYNYNPNVGWDKELELCAKSVKAINRMSPKPAFFIICGDLLDAYPNLWPEVRKKQQEDFLRVYSELDKDVPLVCVCGNHDVGNTPTRETIESYRASFGDDYFSFWVKGAHFLALNSQLYQDPSTAPDLAKAQDVWLDDQLARSKELDSKHRVVFQHIPWYMEDPNEETYELFNMKPEVRAKMLDKLDKGGVSKIFCGHLHRNAGGWYNDRMELVVTTAISGQLGTDAHGMRVVVVGKEAIMHEFHSLEDFPLHVAL